MREKLNPCGRKHMKKIKIKMGLTGLNVLHGVVSSVLSSSAALCGLHCDWLQGATRLLISRFSFGKCRRVCRLKCVVFVATMKQQGPRVQEGPQPLKCDLGGLDSIVCIICCTDISVTTFCLGQWLLCLLWCQSSF